MPATPDSVRVEESPATLIMRLGSDVDYTALDQGDWSIQDEAMRSVVRRSTEAVSSLVRSTLGPRGMEKQILTEAPEGPVETVQTSDASEILDAIERGEGFNHPVAALFVDAVDSMQRGLGDGTTTAILLTQLLVDRGVELVDEGLNPNTVAVGYAAAADRAGEILDDLARPVEEDGNLLEAVARTAMNGQLDRDDAMRYADLVVDSVQGLADESEWLDTDDVKVVTTRRDHDGLYRGVVVQRRPTILEESEESRSEFDWSCQFPTPERDVTVAVIDQEIDFESTASSFETGSETGRGGASTVRSIEELQTYQRELDDLVEAEADRLSALGVDLLVSEPAVSEALQSVLARREIAVLDEIKFPLADVTRIARATGASVVANLEDVGPNQLGTAGVVSERRVGDEKWTYIDECDGGVFTLVARCETETEAERRKHLLEDAVDVTAVAARDRQALPGAGAPAMAVSAALRSERDAVPGRLQLPVEAFADVMESYVGILATNCGHDPLDAVPDLRAAHNGADESPAPLGIGEERGVPVDAWEAGVVEPRRVFSQATETARVTSEQLLTIDAALFPNVDLDRFSPQSEHD